jgi:hypothetical protein
MHFTDQAFWIAVAQIIAIDIVLGGDSAVVIASSRGCDHIVMGTRGLGSHTAGVLGSVAAGCRPAGHSREMANVEFREGRSTSKS